MKRAHVDHFRLICALLVIAIHTSPLLIFGETADFVFTRILARIAVPFFFAATGYFLAPAIKNGDSGQIRKSLKKTLLLYAAGIVLYLPLNVYSGYFREENWDTIVKDLLCEGTFYHLWYLLAAVAGLLLVWFLMKKTGLRTAMAVSVLLYLAGLTGDSYYGLTHPIAGISDFLDFWFTHFSYTRTGLFFAPVFLMLGIWIEGETKKKRACYQSGLVISSILLLTEGLLLHQFSIQRHDSMYLMLVPVIYFLFSLLLLGNRGTNLMMRRMSMYVYLIHPWMIVLVRGAAKAFKLQGILVENSLVHYVAVALLSCTAAWLCCFFIMQKRGIKRMTGEEQGLYPDKG